MSMMAKQPKDCGTFWVECPRCGRNIAIASGFNAAALTRLKVHQILVKLGWRTLPSLKCNLCIKYNL